MLLARHNGVARRGDSGRNGREQRQAQQVDSGALSGNLTRARRTLMLVEWLDRTQPIGMFHVEHQEAPANR